MTLSGITTKTLKGGGSNKKDTHMDIVSITIAYMAAAGLIGLTVESYRPKHASYLEKVMKSEEPKYNGFSLRFF